MPQPTVDSLASVCVELARHSPLAYSMDGYQRDLGLERKKPWPAGTVRVLGCGLGTSSLLYPKLAQGNVRHRGTPPLSVQIPRAVPRTWGRATASAVRTPQTQIRE